MGDWGSGLGDGTGVDIGVWEGGWVGRVLVVGIDKEVCDEG